MTFMTRLWPSALAFATLLACSSSRFTGRDAAAEGGTASTATGGTTGVASGGGSPGSGGASATGGSSAGGMSGTGNASSGFSGSGGAPGGASGISGAGTNADRSAGLGGAGVSGGTAGAGGRDAGGGIPCKPSCTNDRVCCDGICVNVQNDPLNCGTCGHRRGREGYCGDGKCTAPLCSVSDPTTPLSTR